MSSKAREALKQIHELLSIGGKPDTAMCIRYEAAYQIAKEALAEPLRNCDVGTPQEQIKRWEKFCQEHHEYWKPSKSLTAIQRCNCPCHEGNGCNYFIWAQLPYEEMK